MAFENNLSIKEATKAFEKVPKHTQNEAAIVFRQDLWIVHGRTGAIRPECRDIAYAREVASAVRLLEQMNPDFKRKWNKKELKRLFKIVSVVCVGCIAFLFLKSSSLVHQRQTDPDFIEKGLGLEDNAVEKTLGLSDNKIEEVVTHGSEDQKISQAKNQ